MKANLSFAKHLFIPPHTQTQSEIWWCTGTILQQNLYYKFALVLYSLRDKHNVFFEFIFNCAISKIFTQCFAISKACVSIYARWRHSSNPTVSNTTNSVVVELQYYTTHNHIIHAVNKEWPFDWARGIRWTGTRSFSIDWIDSVSLSSIITSLVFEARGKKSDEKKVCGNK